MAPGRPLGYPGRPTGKFLDFSKMFEILDFLSLCFLYFSLYYPLWGLGWASYSAKAQNPKVGASPDLKIHQKSIKKSLKITNKQKWSRNGQRNELSTSRYHRSARNFATILMVATVLWITKVPKILEKKLCAANGPQNSKKKILCNIYIYIYIV